MQRNETSRARLKPILDRAPNADLWRRVNIPKSRDIRLLRPASLPSGERFETPTDAARIDDANIARLLNFRPDLAAEIERCDEGKCASLPSAHEPPGAIAVTSQPSYSASPRSVKVPIRSLRYICAPFQQASWKPPI